MQRLTEKTKYGYKEIDDCCITACSDKLGKLEDIEQELGIELITLFKATFDGVYYVSFGQVINTKDMGFSVAFCKDYLLIIDTEIEHSYHIKDYGKTWALTKEELSHS